MSGEAISLAYEVPDEQRITYKIVPNKGALMNAASIGRQLTLLSKILCWTDDKTDPRKFMAVISRIQTDADGAIIIDFIVAAKMPSPLPPAQSGSEK